MKLYFIFQLWVFNIHFEYFFSNEFSYLEKRFLFYELCNIFYNSVTKGLVLRNG